MPRRLDELCQRPKTEAVLRAVFVGEVDKGKVSGFHNWIAFQAQEAAGALNYLGHLLPRGRCAPPTSWHSRAAGKIGRLLP